MSEILNHINTSNRELARRASAGGASFGGDMGGGGTASTADLKQQPSMERMFVWVATQFNNSITRVRASDGAVAGTYKVGKRPVALLYAAVLGKYEVGKGPFGVASDVENVWVTNYFGQTVTQYSGLPETCGNKFTR